MDFLNFLKNLFHKKSFYQQYIEQRLETAEKAKQSGYYNIKGIIVPYSLGTTGLTEIITEFNKSSWKQSYQRNQKTITKQEQLYFLISDFYQKWTSEHLNGLQNIYANLGIVLIMDNYLKAVQRFGIKRTDNRVNFHPDYLLLAGLLFYESGGKVNYVSKANAKGLFQLQTAAFKDTMSDLDLLPRELLEALNISSREINLQNIKDPRVNLLASALYLRRLYDEHKQTRNSIALSIIGYLCGMQTVATIISNTYKKHRRATNGSSTEILNENNLNLVDIIDSIKSNEIKTYLLRILSSSMIININNYLTELVKGAIEKHNLTDEDICNHFGISKAKIDRAVEIFKDNLNELQIYFHFSEKQKQELIKNATYSFVALAIQIIKSKNFEKNVNSDPYIIHVMFERPKEYAKIIGLVDKLDDGNREKEIKNFVDKIRKKLQQRQQIVKNAQPNLSSVPVKKNKRKISKTAVPVTLHDNLHDKKIVLSRDKIPLTTNYEYGRINARFKLNMTNPISPLKDRSELIATDGKINAQPFFGAKRGIGRKHKGLDIYAPIGTNVRAAQEGIVIYVQNEDMYGKDPKTYKDNPYLNRKGNVNFVPYGKFVIIKHKMRDPPGYYYTSYAHLQEVKVKKGQVVKRGDIIGTVGISGNAKNAQNAIENSHVHFDLRIPKPIRDPKTRKYLSIPPYDGENCKAVDPLIMH
ncbi:MAG: peptidoglycan DD-metalloendopeptidase family protein [Candidatus Anstonellales archaeon]